MESIFKISILLLLSLTKTTKTNSYADAISSAATATCATVPAEEACTQKEMGGFWLTQILMVEE